MICEQLMLDTFWGQRTVDDDGSVATEHMLHFAVELVRNRFVLCAVVGRCARTRGSKRDRAGDLGAPSAPRKRGVWGCNLPLVAAARWWRCWLRLTRSVAF